MSASADTMVNFIEAFRCEAERYKGLHPSCDARLNELFWELHTAVDNPAKVSELIKRVRHVIARELRWCAENNEAPWASPEALQRAAQYRAEADQIEGVR